MKSGTGMPFAFPDAFLKNFLFPNCVKTQNPANVFDGKGNLPGSPKLPPCSFVHRPIGKESGEGWRRIRFPFSRSKAC